MSRMFHAGDRAYLMDASGTGLRMGQLYHVRACYMDRVGVQKLNLTGSCTEGWYLASRFVRVADPVPRVWPRE